MLILLHFCLIFVLFFSVFFLIYWFMDKVELSFNELILIAKSVKIDFDLLVCESSSGNIIKPNGKVAQSEEFDLIDLEYDKLTLLMKVYNQLFEFRPLPF